MTVRRTLFRLSVAVVPDGEIRLDGGALFGMVPREKWAADCPPDERNRVTLAMNSLLVRGPDFALVIDPGAGPAVDASAYGIRKERTLEDGLAAEGLAPGDVTHVLYTHLHFDHSGGGDRFPNAQHLVQAAEYEAARAPHPLHRASYRGAGLPPADRTRLIDGDAEVLPGVRAIRTGGHTPGHQAVVLDDRAIVMGDLLPTRHHLSPLRATAFDADPLRVVDAKQDLLTEAARRGWLAFLYHDPDPAPFRIEADGGRFRAAAD